MTPKKGLVTRHRTSKLRNLRASKAKHGREMNKKPVIRLLRKKFAVRFLPEGSLVPKKKPYGSKKKKQEKSAQSDDGITLLNLECPQCGKIHKDLRPLNRQSCESCGWLFMPMMETPLSGGPIALRMAPLEWSPNMYSYINCPYGCGRKITPVTVGEIVVCEHVHCPSKGKKEIWVYGRRG